MMETPIKMDDLGVPLFLETPISTLETSSNVNMRNTGHTPTKTHLPLNEMALLVKRLQHFVAAPKSPENIAEILNLEKHMYLSHVSQPVISMDWSLLMIQSLISSPGGSSQFATI